MLVNFLVLLYRKKINSSTCYFTADRPKFAKQLEDQTIKDRDYACMNVRCSGVPEPQIKWYKDGVELTSGEKVKITTTTEAQVSSRLEIEHFSVNDVGKVKYKCEIL